MEERKIFTEIDLKYFKDRIIIEEKLPTINPEMKYTYRVSYKKNLLILKGFKIRLEPLLTNSESGVESFKKSLDLVGEVYQEYALMKFASSLSPHFPRPLFLDSAINTTSDNNSYFHIEILFENVGNSLDKQKQLDANMIYSLMRQSANALLLLDILGIRDVEFKASNVAYDRNKDLLKFLEIKKDYKKDRHISEYPLVGSSKKKEGKELRSISVRSWAEAFNSLVLEGSKQDAVAPEAKPIKYAKVSLEEGKSILVQQEIQQIVRPINIRAEINPGDIIENRKKRIGEILTEALRDNPRDKLTIRKLIERMKNAEMRNFVPFDYAKVEKSNNAKLQRLFILNNDFIRGSKHEFAKSGSDSKVKLSCGHSITKEILTLSIAKSLALREGHHEIFCSKCRGYYGWTSMILNCGCKWTNNFFGSRVDLSHMQCFEGHPLNYNDICLLSESAPYKFVAFALDEHLNREEIKDAIETCMLELEGEKQEDIVEVVNNTNLFKSKKLGKNLKISLNYRVGLVIAKLYENILGLTLHKLRIGKKAALAIIETLESAKRITSLRLLECTTEDNSLNDGEFKGLFNGLKQNKVLTELIINNSKIIGEQLKDLNDFIKVTKSLKTLSLTRCELQDTEGELLAEALAVNKSLTYVDLDGNNIKEKAAIAFSKVLKASNTLTELIITKNPLSKRAIEELKGMPNTKVKATVESLPDPKSIKRHVFYADCYLCYDPECKEGPCNNPDKYKLQPFSRRYQPTTNPELINSPYVLPDAYKIITTDFPSVKKASSRLPINTNPNKKPVYAHSATRAFPAPSHYVKKIPTYAEYERDIWHHYENNLRLPLGTEDKYI